MNVYNKIVECLQRINELNYAGFKEQQRGITKLFKKYPERVKAINANGGIRLVYQLPGLWKFQVASGTKKGKKYDVFIRFRNVGTLLRENVPDPRLWKKNKTGVNLNLLAARVFNKVDMEISCSCPATLYWGHNYIRTRQQAQFGFPETRRPGVRNPNEHGIVCKHGGDVLERLPFYTSTFGSWLKSYYMREIEHHFKNSIKA